MQQLAYVQNNNFDELNELNNIIDNKNISTVYQAIVSLTDGEAIGYEALSRGPLNSALYNPMDLFDTAKRHGKSWDLELLCRIKAIQRAKSLDNNKLLFINVDPNIFENEKFGKGLTKQFLDSNNISSDNIVFEITERNCIDNLSRFKSSLNHFTQEGYKIAIDDVGSGYSGLKMLSDAKPHYVKIDMDLIRDIDKDTFKQYLIEYFVKLSNLTNMKLIAEGIETYSELDMLIKLGVHFGQGFYMSRPSESIVDIPSDIKSAIKSCFYSQTSDFDAYSPFCIGQISRTDRPFEHSTPCKDLKDYFSSVPTVNGICIIKNDIPVGLLMKHSLDSALATQYGIAIFTKRPVSLIMDTAPLIVDYDDSLTEVTKAAMQRDNFKIYDYILVTKNNKYHGIVTIKSLLEYTTTVEKKYAMQLNPLTELPGNIMIQNKIKTVRSINQNFCILYFDLDNFKVYNDTYGFENGDKILKYTADILKSIVSLKFPVSSFVGHIGGDDFIAIIESSSLKCERLCQDIITKFNSGILNFFNHKDKSNKFIESIDRKGFLDKFPLTSLSIAGLYGNFSKFNNCADIGETAAKIKKRAKIAPGSSFILDCLG